MGLYNFQKRFAPFILSGAKTHTIRATRAHPDKPGNILHLYTGLRTKHTELLMRVPCVKVERIWIYSGPNMKFLPDDFRVFIDGERLDKSEREEFARRDGFADFADMLKFLEGLLPFTGQLIHWKFKNQNEKA